jgi:LuxR family maltose regulon positive regulatory protein
MVAHTNPVARAEGVGGAAAVLLATKLQVPVARRRLVPRPRLLQQLAAAAWPRLILVDAPAGAGKTTLLADWQRANPGGRAAAWLSLDPGDNDPVRFWTYVAEALRAVVPGVGAQALSLVRVPGISLVDVVLPALLNDLGTLDRDAVLVLDDYHVITTREVHVSVTFLLEHLPPALRLVIATRSDPPLPLARLRARGELLEVRAEDLRFDAQEAGVFLNDVLGLGLDASDVARLHDRTEGWAAGLYLAALSLGGRDDARRRVDAFAGDDRHIVDYLGAEVLANQPAEVRAFLLQTAILDRLCGPLCDAVREASNSALLLEQIESSNLFLIPLDSKRAWYRYHHLFGELLRHELARASPGGVPALHRRAADWYREQGAIPEAIDHATAAGDLASARELIAHAWNAFFNQGRLATVARWLDALPAAAVRDDPRLCVARAWLALDTGRLAEVEPWIEAAEGSLRSDPAANGAALASETAVLGGVVRFKAGDVGQARAAARRALEAGAAATGFARTVAQLVLGVTLYWSGEAAVAAAALQEAERLARSTGNDLAAGYSLGYQALLTGDRGEPDDAHQLARAALELSHEPGFGEHFVLMVAHLAEAKAHEQQGNMPVAEVEASRAVELARRGAGRIEMVASLAALARARVARGNRASAAELLREARTVAAQCADASAAVVGQLAHAEHGLLSPERTRRPVRAVALQQLTERELAVLRLLPSRRSQREIAAALVVSPNTVKTHTRGIYNKLAASTRAEAVARARELGLL